MPALKRYLTLIFARIVMETTLEHVHDTSHNTTPCNFSIGYGCLQAPYALENIAEYTGITRESRGSLRLEGPLRLDRLLLFS